MADAFDLLEMEPEVRNEVQTGQRISEAQDAFDIIQPKNKDSVLKSWLRTLYQVPSGAMQAFTYPLDLMQFAGVGDVLDPEEIDHIRKISEREGIPFDEDKYMQAVQNAVEYFPTQSNIERIIEEKTGAPLTPQTELQKAVKLGSIAGTFAPGTALQKGAAAIAAPTVSAGLQQAGLPEPLAELAGLATSAGAAKLVPEGAIKIKPVTKPSGLPKRRFEKLKEPRIVSPKKFEQIHEKLERDFRKISDEIIKESPISKTKATLEENPAFKTEVAEQFREVESLAESLPEKINTSDVKKTILNKTKEKIQKGISPSDYDKDYKKFMNKFVREMPSKEVKANDLVSQYRKNNKSLSEAYDPAKPYSFNRAKKDALLDYNRSIADMIQEKFPDSEFSNLFKETNKQWAEIADAEAIDKFIDGMFDGKIDFRKGKKFFENKNIARPFKRALGDNFSKFEQLMKDMLSTEKAAKMLKVAKQKGYPDLVKKAVPYIINPKLGLAKTAIDIGKETYHSLINSMIDKPELMITWESGVKALKAGKFAEAEKMFDKLEKEISPVAEAKTKKPEKVFYHGTQKEFDKFEKTSDIGFHFSESPETAKEFALGAEAPGPGRIITSELKIKNPLRTDDLVSFSSTNLSEFLDKKGLKPKNYKSFKEIIRQRLGIEPYEGPVSKRPSSAQAEANALKDIKKELKDLGYDSIVYENKFEGPKTDSYIVFDNKDIIQKKSTPIKKGQKFKG